MISRRRISSRALLCSLMGAQVAIYASQVFFRETLPAYAVVIDALTFILTTLSVVGWAWHERRDFALVDLQIVFGGLAIWFFSFLVVPAFFISLARTGLLGIPAMKESVLQGLLISTILSIPIPLVITFLLRRKTG